MARDLFDLAASAKRTADAIPTAQQQATAKAAQHALRFIRAEILSVTGDMRLSGTRGNKRVGAGYDKVYSTGTNSIVYVKGRGAIALIENDTPPHIIWPKGQTFTEKGRRRGKRKALHFGGRFAAYTEHPGTTGKHPFQKGARKAEITAPAVYQAAVRDAVRKAW